MPQPPQQLLPIALTCGEPAGIAPEITAKAWSILRDEIECCFFLIGDGDYISARAAAAGLPLQTARITRPAEAVAMFRSKLPVLHRPMPAQPTAGIIDKTTAPAVIAAIDEGFHFALSGEAAALVTNPIQKDALYAAGFKHQGHTDYLAALAAKAGFASQEVMMLVAKDLRVVPVTVHIPLKEVPAALTQKLIVDQAMVVVQALQSRFGIAAPRLGLTGLNPHAGESGAMGKEEQTVIIPAIEQIRQAGVQVAGPLSADTAFHEEARAAFDAILCMYHDQALIPAKTLDFHGGVNVTLGLACVRTSPDHGTALGIAGTGKANAQSLVAAIRLAGRMAAHGRD